MVVELFFFPPQKNNVKNWSNILRVMLGKLKASLLNAYCLNIGGAEAGRIMGAARFLGVDGCLPCLVLCPAAPTRDFLPPDAGCSSMRMRGQAVFHRLLGAATARGSRRLPFL